METEEGKHAFLKGLHKAEEKPETSLTAQTEVEKRAKIAWGARGDVTFFMPPHHLKPGCSLKINMPPFGRIICCCLTTSAVRRALLQLNLCFERRVSRSTNCWDQNDCIIAAFGRWSPLVQIAKKPEMKYFLIIGLFVYSSLCKTVLGGCCNNNFWCDGDPR